MSIPSFAVFSSSEDPEIIPTLRSIITGADSEFDVQAVSTFEEGITSSADVLILFIGDDPSLELNDELEQHLKQRKVIGIGYTAAQLFEALRLEIKGGACAHYGTVAPKIKVEESELIQTPPFEGPIRPVQLSPKAMNLDHFAMHIPRYSDLLSVVDVIARAEDDENYAPIVRQGNYVLIGLVAPPEIWTPEYRELFRNIAIALHERKAEQFSRAQWNLTKPGTYDFALAEGFSTNTAFAKEFYFRFSKLTTFSATLQHEGSDSMMLLFMGEKNREHWTREDAKEGEVLEISIDITEEDLKEIEDWYWVLDVTNFDRAHTAECSLRIEYQE